MQYNHNHVKAIIIIICIINLYLIFDGFTPRDSTIGFNFEFQVWSEKSHRGKFDSRGGFFYWSSTVHHKRQFQQRFVCILK